MSMKPNQKASRFLIVINDKKEATTQQVMANLKRYQNTLLNYSILEYIATIIHDKDTNDNGELKRPHLHAFIETKEPYTMKAFLGQLMELLKIEAEQISIDTSNNEFLGIQYLIHKNDQEKTQYQVNEIKTNNDDETSKRLGQVYKTENEKLIDALNQSETFNELMSQIGVEKANKYRGLFKDLRIEKNEATLWKMEKARMFDRLMEALIDSGFKFETIENRAEYQDLLTVLQDCIEVYKNNDFETLKK